MGSLYEHDPEMAPDSEFQSGRLDLLVVGNEGRLLDARRTPVRVVRLRPELAFFEVEVLAFEDRGARWELPMDAVDRFQFTLGAMVADAASVADYSDAVSRFDKVVEIPVTDTRQDLTLERLAGERLVVRDWFEKSSSWAHGDRVLDADAVTGDQRLFDDLATFMASRDLTAIETAFTRRYVSNPHAGEEVIGHVVVAAELGLVAYRGPGQGSRQHRRRLVTPAARRPPPHPIGVRVHHVHPRRPSQR